MSLIFDTFPNDTVALAFALTVKRLLELEWSLCSTQHDSNAIDPFPYMLTPPIVVIDRPYNEDAATEASIAELVLTFDGRFAGT